MSEAVDELMIQAQVFASAWSLVGGRFDTGHCSDAAKEAKLELEKMVRAALAAAPAQPDTHPTTGEPMGTDAQEATAWRPKAENLEREIKPLRLYENLAKEYGILVFGGLEELQRENAALRDALQGAVSMAKDAHGHWDEDRDAKVGKHLLALAGANKGYDKRADAIHAAIAAQQGEQT